MKKQINKIFIFFIQYQMDIQLQQQAKFWLTSNKVIRKMDESRFEIS